MTTQVLLGLSYATGEPEVRVRSGDATESVLTPLGGLRLAYRSGLDAPRVCLGHVPFRDRTIGYVDCLKTPAAGERSCDRCRAHDATFASQLHHAHTRDRSTLESAMATHLAQPNVVYIAGFRDGSLKVGTSTAHRLETRLAEQGAWRARLVADTTDGYAVRDIEDEATIRLDLAQTMAIGRKLTGQVSPVADPQLDGLLDAAASDFADLVLARADDRITTRSDTWVNPVAGSAVWDRLLRYPLKLDQGAHDVTVVAACGRVVVLERPGGDRFVADIGKLFGRVLRLTDEDDDTTEAESDEILVQDALF